MHKFCTPTEAFLQDDETVDAEVFLNKASSCIQTVTDISLLLRYRATSARVLDANRKFVEAAMRYYDLSNTTLADVSICCHVWFVSSKYAPYRTPSHYDIDAGQPRGFNGAARQGSYLCSAWQVWTSEIQSTRSFVQGIHTLMSPSVVTSLQSSLLLSCQEICYYQIQLPYSHCHHFSNLYLHPSSTPCLIASRDLTDLWFSSSVH